MDECKPLPMGATLVTNEEFMRAEMEAALVDKVQQEAAARGAAIAELAELGEALRVEADDDSAANTEYMEAGAHTRPLLSST